MSLLSMIRGLTGASIRYVVIGGVAGTVHGSVRVTNDLDLCYDVAENNRSALAALLGSWNAYLRGVEFAAIGLPALIDAKRAAGRDRDIEHLRELEALLERQERMSGDCG